MITGFNVELDHDGKRFHVQTEDKGRNDAVIETLIYIGGKILHSERTLYRDIAENCTDKDIAVLMEMQHTRIVRRIRSGRFDDAPRKAFGEDMVSEKSLDDVVLDFFKDAGEDSLELVLRGDAALVPGQTVRVRVLARGSVSGKPIPGAEIIASLDLGNEKSVPVARLTAGADGSVTIPVAIPHDVGLGASLVIECSGDRGTDQVRQLIAWSRSG